MDKPEFEKLVGVLREALVDGEDREEDAEDNNFLVGLHSIDYKGLRKLVVPDLSRLRKIQGV